MLYECPCVGFNFSTHCPGSYNHRYSVGGEKQGLPLVGQDFDLGGKSQTSGMNYQLSS